MHQSKEVDRDFSGQCKPPGVHHKYDFDALLYFRQKWISLFIARIPRVCEDQ